MWRTSRATRASTDRSDVRDDIPRPSSAAAASPTAAAPAGGSSSGSHGATHKWPLRTLFSSAAMPSQTSLARQYQLHKKANTVESDDEWAKVEPMCTAAAKRSALAFTPTTSLMHTSGGDGQPAVVAPTHTTEATAAATASPSTTPAIVQLSAMDHVRQRRSGLAPLVPSRPFGGVGDGVVGSLLGKTLADGDEEAGNDWGEPVQPTSVLPGATTAAPLLASSPSTVTAVGTHSPAIVASLTVVTPLVVHAAAARTHAAADDDIFVSDEAALAHHHSPTQTPSHANAIHVTGKTVAPTQLLQTPLTSFQLPSASACPPAASPTVYPPPPYTPAPANFDSGIRGLRTAHNSCGGASSEPATLDRGKRKKKGLGAVAVLSSTFPATPAAPPPGAPPATSESDIPPGPRSSPPHQHPGGTDPTAATHKTVNAEAERLRLDAEKAERLRLDAEEAERLRLDAEEAGLKNDLCGDARAVEMLLGTLCKLTHGKEVVDRHLIQLVESISDAQELLLNADPACMDGIESPITCYREVVACMQKDVARRIKESVATGSGTGIPHMENAVGALCEKWSVISASLPAAWGWAWESAVHRPTSVADAERGQPHRRNTVASLAVAVAEAGDSGIVETPLWTAAQCVASALIAHVVRWARQLALARSHGDSSVLQSLAEFHSIAAVPPHGAHDNGDFSLATVHACVLAVVRETLSSSRQFSPADATETETTLAAWVSPLLDCVALAVLLRDEEIKAHATFAMFTSPGGTRYHGNRVEGLDSATTAAQHVQRQLREGSWMVWYVLRVVGLMIWWDAVQPTLAQQVKVTPLS